MGILDSHPMESTTWKMLDVGDFIELKDFIEQLNKKYRIQ